MKRLLLLALAVTLMGQDCEDKMPDGGNAYCAGNEYTVLDSLVDGVAGIWNAIIGGEESADRRATVQVFFGQSYCSGVALSPDLVLTAGHCGHASTTTHRVRIDGLDYNSTAHVVHPDYLRYVADPTDSEARKSDLMLLYMDSPIPPPYVSTIYQSKFAKLCNGLVAQGWGKDEFPETGAMLREAKYLITEEKPKLLTSLLTPEGKICFGDSGGPLYADLVGNLQLAGITTTTFSQDCLTGGNHVNLNHPSHQLFIAQNSERP